MRKHFLILMLFALLPLAGWAAEPLSSVKLSVANVTYGTAALDPNEDFLANWDASLTYGVDVIWDGKIYSNQACTTEVTELATASVGTYYVKFTGGHYYEGTSVCQFKVLKAPLYVSILGDITGGTNDDPYVGGNLLTTYGEAFDITEHTIEDVKGLQNEEEFEDVVSGSLTAVTVTETNANATDESTDANVTLLDGAKAYQATLSSFTSTNYELVCVDKFYIKQKNISDGEGLVFALNPNFTTYNGKIQDAEYTITYKGETLVQATRKKDGSIDKNNDFTLSYKVCTWTQDANTLKKTITGVTGDNLNKVTDANIYATQIVGHGNFTGTYPAAEDITATSVYGNDPFVWTIKQAGLTIIALDQTKVYDTTTELPHKYTAPSFDTDGNETTDPAKKAENNLVVTVLWPYGIGQAEANNIMTNVKVTTTAKSDVGKYTIKPSCTVANNTPNYEFNYVDGTFTITKRNLTITASDATKLYTASTNPAFGVAIYDGYDFELSNDERAAADGGDALLAKLRKDIYEGHGATAGSVAAPATTTFLYKANDTDAKKGAGLKVELKDNTPTTIGVHGGALEVKYSKYGLINNYEVKTVAGNFTISGGKIFVTALKQEKNYGADDPDWTPVKGVNYRIDGLIAADKDKDVEGLVLTREEGEDVGSYRITASGATAPAGYLDIVYADGEFVINPRPITITVQNQTMKDGAKVSTLNTTAYTIDNTDDDEGLAPGEAADEIFTLAFEDANIEASPATFNFSSWSAEKEGTQYTTGIAAFVGYSEEEGLTEIQVTRNGEATMENPGEDPFVKKHFYIEANPADGIPVARKQLYKANDKGQLTALDVWVKITKGADAIESADKAPIDATGKVLELDPNENYQKFVRSIKVVAVDQAKYDNYVFTVNRGSLYLLDKDALVLDDQDEALAENIAAKNGEKRVFVAFGSRVLKAGQWNTLVLPFKTSVQELSETLGYVVVDRLNEENTDASTISIVLGFGDIPANTPFLVQPEADVDLADGIFFQKNIVYGGANPEAADQAGHKLIGTYEGVKLAAGSTTDYYYSTTYKEFRNPGANGTNIGKMRAYLKDESGSAARIMIEEPNGDTTITAIREVNAAEAVKAEGWYTINGIKLNAAPTQKGIYINNGKKIVVK